MNIRLADPTVNIFYSYDQRNQYKFARSDNIHSVIMTVFNMGMDTHIDALIW